MLLKEESITDLAAENQLLLNELEQAYEKMEVLLLQTAEEKAVTYQELELKVETLEKLYLDVSNKENMLVHLEKLSSIGQFVSEIIHELSNPLGVISGNIELALEMDPPAHLFKFLNNIQISTDRLTTYLRNFSNMAYKGEEYFTVFDVNQNLTEVINTIDLLKPKNVRITVTPSERPLLVRGDVYQINQIYLNMAKNAFDAMSECGNRLTFTTRRVTVDWLANSGEMGTVYCQKPPKWNDLMTLFPAFALIEITDNGEGITPDKLENIFAAFFTTKERGKGTGLGLSISSDIALRHSSNIAVKSVEGEGTTFQILIPLVD